MPHTLPIGAIAPTSAPGAGPAAPTRPPGPPPRGRGAWSTRHVESKRHDEHLSTDAPMTAVRPPRRRSTSAPTRSAPKLLPIPGGLKLTPPKVPAGTVYRGTEGMWSWVLHRITGVAIFFFLLVHILDTALVRLSPAAYDAVISTYKNPIM